MHFSNNNLVWDKKLGSHAHFEIAGYPFFSMKSYVDSKIASLFDERHRQVMLKKVSERNPITWGTIEDDGTVEQVFQYRMSGNAMKRRLSILGFSEERVKVTFEERIRHYRECLTDDEYVSGLPFDNQHAIDFLNDYSFSKWCSAIRQFVTPEFSRAWFAEESPERDDPILALICSQLDDPSRDFIYGFPSFDFRLFIQAVLMACEANDPVLLDFTELVYAGYYEEDVALADSAKHISNSELDATAKIIVLTEGKSDSRLIRRSMELLHPELAPLYSFVDFELPKLDGGVGSLVRVLKGFIGAGVTNKIIALFDNDTAAYDAVRAFDSINLPKNIAILHYPDLPYAMDYPTIGPTGLQNMNINGLAGGLELYFGLDVLRQPDGTNTPVHWRGYIPRLQRYQGELYDKSRLQDSFESQLEQYARDPGIPADWSGIKLVLDAIFGVFEKDHCRLTRESSDSLFLPYF